MNNPVKFQRPRIDAGDVTRGVIMIIMTLDHTRDFFGIPGQNPVAMATTTPTLFFTRWITHFCAPVFLLLVAASYPLCRWFAALKQRRKDAWLSYR